MSGDVTTRRPSYCAICHAMSGEGVRASTRTHGMVVCPQHGSQLKSGLPLTPPRTERDDRDVEGCDA